VGLVSFLGNGAINSGLMTLPANHPLDLLRFPLVGGRGAYLRGT